MDNYFSTQEKLLKHDEKQGQFSFDLSGRVYGFLVWFPPEADLGQRYKYDVFIWEFIPGNTRKRVRKRDKEGKNTKKQCPIKSSIIMGDWSLPPGGNS